MNNDGDFSFAGYPIGEDLEYFIHEGGNLISFPSEGSYPIESVLPDNLSGVVYAIISEGVSALYLDGSWEGTLNNFYGGQGYWFKCYEKTSFVFDRAPLELSKNTDDKFPGVKKLEHFEYAQSTEQAFYYVDTVSYTHLTLPTKA